MFIRPTNFMPVTGSPIDYETTQYVPADDGSTDVVTISARPAPLPFYDSMAIGDMIAAGLPLQRVNPHILGEQPISEDLATEKIIEVVNSQTSPAPASVPPVSEPPASVPPASVPPASEPPVNA